MEIDVLSELAKTLEKRKKESENSSYVAGLHAKGLNKILEKIGEESIETIIAAKDAVVSNNKSALIYETADLWFHTLLMLSHLDLGPDDILSELMRRFDFSGLVEKASRNKITRH